ncbi:MAG: hypothetical protein KKI09_13400 [Spirochaetes bacterium]|nr:hypothetical protein [Spirochaetota bacterium]MBU0956420.1 hypothetical protein [Spirochaetota bacterium]
MSFSDDSCLIAENPGIGLYSETGLHAALKRLYAGPQARFEVKIARKIVDVVNPDEYVEIQTRNLAAIKDKLLSLACLKAVRVVVPIHAERYIERIDETGQVLAGLRKSPLRRDLYHIFDELVHAPCLVASPNLAVDVLLVRVVEQRRRTQIKYRGRYRDEVVARNLAEVLSCHSFSCAADWLKLLPPALPPCFTSSMLGAALKISSERARKILYTYVRAGLVQEAGKQGREKLYTRQPAG